MFFSNTSNLQTYANFLFCKEFTLAGELYNCIWNRNEREGGINANKKRINRIDGCGAVRSCFYKALPFPVAWACDSTNKLSLFLYNICVCDTTAHQTNCLSNHVIYDACTVYRISRYDIYSELLCVYGAWLGKID